MSLSLARTKNMDEGVWFEYDEDVSFKIRCLTPDKIRELRRPLVKKKWKKGDLIELVDDNDFSWAINNYMLADWKGIELEPGKPAECTPENKKIFFKMHNDPALFILESAQKLGSYQQEKQEKEEKN